ncbi:MAG: PAS domain-containing sensor histidine kinase [Holosporaceae bacterium]|jgi:PAS domain S-box-containing protein|nr:PAS domain-containing sensor histidine kinase [Holosporaceae bacterium]
MIKKILETLKTTLCIAVFALIPILIAVKFIGTSSEKDFSQCIDTFVHADGVGISKYASLQFENTQKEISTLLAWIRLTDFSKKKNVQERIKSIIKRNPHMTSVNIYEEDGKFFTNASEKEEPNLSITEDMEKLQDEILYFLEQQEDKSIILKYTFSRKINKKKFIFEIKIKWNRYEKYMDQLEEGSFPRTYYIVSPNYQRYISLNSLPKSSKGDKGTIALGLHLSQKISTIPQGFSDIIIESFKFRLFCKEITMPPKMLGGKLFVIVATDNNALDVISKGISGSISSTRFLLVLIIFIVSVVGARFYIKMKGRLGISNAISEATPLAVVIFKNKDGKIYKINSAGCSLLMIEKERVSEINTWNLFIEETDKNYISKAIDSNINVFNYEVLLQSLGGGSFWSVCSASPISIDEEKYIVLAILDINRRKEIEKKLANNASLLEQQIAERTADLDKKAKELEESNILLEKAKIIADEASNAKSKFLTSMSNELKTPLNAIIGYAEILEEEALDRKDTVSADDLHKITSSAKHLLSLINEILDLSKIEAGKTQLFFENIKIADIIKDVEGVAMPLVAKNDNSLFLEFPKDIGDMYSDQTKIRQCLLNILGNATKFTEFGKITIRIAPVVKSGEDFIEFSVIDTGIGISPEKLEGIFEPFNEEKGNSGGGLGLSITKKYTECLGGTITVESEVGVGSKFVIRLPRVCKTEASDSIEIKNNQSDDAWEESVDEYSLTGDSGTTEANTFGKKSDQSE